MYGGVCVCEYVRKVVKNKEKQKKKKKSKLQLIKLYVKLCNLSYFLLQVSFVEKKEEEISNKWAIIIIIMWTTMWK